VSALSNVKTCFKALVTVTVLLLTQDIGVDTVSRMDILETYL
jgi:hypothetical protein